MVKRLNTIEYGDQIRIGTEAGQTSQGEAAIAIGMSAGNTGQNNSSIAIGQFAGAVGQYPKTIVINASGTVVNGSSNANATYIKPIQSVEFANTVTFDSATGELGQSTPSLPMLAATEVMSGTTLTIPMENLAYKTANVQTNNNDIEVLTLTDFRAGAQAVIFIEGTVGTTQIHGFTSGLGGVTLCAHDDFSIAVGEKVVMTAVNNHTNTFVSASLYK